MRTLIYLIFALCLGMVSQTYAQSPSIKGKVAYEYTTLFQGIPMTREASLIFDQHSSLFTHSQGQGPKIFDRAGNEVSYETMSSTNVADKGVMFGIYIQDPIGNVYYKNSQTGEIIFREIVINQPLLVREPEWIEFEWELTAETKTIGRFQCQAATTHFRGRTYKAWYTDEIPLSMGPWKFHGLPGLILEVEDAKGEVSFKAKAVEIPSQEMIKITPPTKGKKVSLEDFFEADYKILMEIHKANQALNENSGSNFEQTKEIPKVELTLD